MLRPAHNPPQRDPDRWIRAYLVLDTERAVSYGIPRPGTALDVVAEAMRRVRVEAV